ncbi:MAG: sugar phosphate isomerase/epimerase [Blastocatellia bacterium]|nr:sugar phosphate isomerase/epimerase [Blastocatellia bacterium]
MSTTMTRRVWNQLAIGAAAAAMLPRETFAAAKPNSRIKGVQLGAQSYSFRDRSLDDALKAYGEVGLSCCELWSGHLEPSGLKRDDLRKWRLTTPLSFFNLQREKFQKAGVELYALNYSFREDFTDEEIARGFEITRALGARVITASSNVTTARRIDPFAKKYKIRVGMHNHSRIVANEFATPDDFAKAMDGMSEYICINLDIGHFTAANFDAVDFLQKHHDRIVTLHIKDRKRNQGDNVVFGEGDTPIKPVLELLMKNKWKIPANIEYEYKGPDTIAEMKRCYDYCRKALGA